MPIEIRRFGVGHRRPDGPPGTVGIEGRVIESRASGSIAELAFGRYARITPHSNPRWTCLLVIEGGGWVGVGDERSRVTAGEAVVWPPDVLHAAWTDGVPMRAIVVELAEDPAQIPAVIPSGVPDAAEVEVVAVVPPRRPVRPVSRGEGRLADRPVDRRPEPAEGGGEGEPA
jgi:quercetin dioxygenase-like cupin family protein